MIQNADTLFEFSIQHLFEAVKRSNHDFHTCSVASITTDGYPANRTVVFRHLSNTLDYIYIHSDARSEKNKDFLNNKNASLLFYSKQNKLQVRFSASAEICYDNQETKNAFYQSSLCAKRGYSYKFIPGSQISALKKELLQPELNGDLTQDQLEFGCKNFSIIKFKLISCDILHLLRTGHIRLKGHLNQSGWNLNLVAA